MHRHNMIKYSFIIIAFLETVLFFTLDSTSFVPLVILPLLYLLLLLFAKKQYKKKLRKLSLAGIDRLSGLDFEYYLFYLFKRHGIRTRITPYSHDFGADLILKYRGKKVVIQAKRWNENVGIKAVQETLGAMSYYKAKYGVVITNSFYTKSAIELANASDIVLINRNDLAHFIDCESDELWKLLLNRKEKKILFYQTNSEVCPYCNNKLVKRNGRYGSFYGCSNYPNCTYTKNIS